MIEVIAGVWLTSFVLSLIVTGFNFYTTRKRLNSQRLTILNFNLAKVDKYWSNSTANFAPLTANAIEMDAAKTLRNTLLMGLLGLASLIGLILLLTVVISLHYLVRSRREVATFRSALATDKNLSQGEVEKIVTELAQIL
jgi:hypothetical protein